MIPGSVGILHILIVNVAMKLLKLDRPPRDQSPDSHLVAMFETSLRKSKNEFEGVNFRVQFLSFSLNKPF